MNKIIFWLATLLLNKPCSILALSAPSASPSTSASTTHKASTSNPRRVPWLIVGGGIHGVHIASRLLGIGVTKDLCIVDDAPALLHQWKVRTAATGMEYLRSSAGYHLDLSEDSLRQFGRTLSNGSGSRSPHRGSFELFSKDYERPRLDLFNRHCDGVVCKYQLNEKHVRGRVTSIEPTEDHVRVHVSSGPNDTEYMCILADQVVLALGNDDPSYPEWATPDLLNGHKVRHLLDCTNSESQSSSGGNSHTTPASVAIIGGGITAAHKALQLSQKAQEVHLISRHPMKEQQFDTHQDWMMDRAAAQRSQVGGGSGIPKKQRMFRDTRSWQQRRQIIAQERLPGTVTAAVHRGKRGLQNAIRNDRVQWHQGEVTSALEEGDQVQLTLSTGTTLQVDQILLATGFGKKPPSLPVLHNNNLGPVSDFCGYPIVDPTLRWGHARIFVTGALAELELGPSARNIAGARLAAERILQAASTTKMTQTE